MQGGFAGQMRLQRPGQLVLAAGSLRFKPAPEPAVQDASAPAPAATAPDTTAVAGPETPAPPDTIAPLAAEQPVPTAEPAEAIDLLPDPMTSAPAASPEAGALNTSPTHPHIMIPEAQRSGTHTPITSSGTDAGAPTLLDEDDTSPTPALTFVPYNRAGLNERHADNFLQTASTAERLDQSLRRIDEQARSTLEEQGVNALFLALGMLHYLESTDSTEVFRAPLVLAPVELTRKSARAGYTLKATEDEPLVNPALAEYLRRMHKLGLPELPVPLPEDYDLQAFLTATAAAIANLNGWAVKNEIYLGLFSFQKFVMYKDLEANTSSFVGHPLIQQLIQRAGGQFLSLPNDVRALELDRDYPPEATFQVVDADSSQIRALAAVARQHNLVIEGPPGTGKSQTITNLIAQALSAGKSVLFVAEKMAALQVVHRRLVAAGLGEFCLELHSTKANKRAVMRELAAALDASLQRPAVPSHSTQRLPLVRHSLTEYAHAVHAPHGALELSPFRAYGELGTVLAAPRLKYSGPADTVTATQLDQTVRELDDLAQAAAPIGPVAEHPWRDAGRTFYTEDDLVNIHAHATELHDRLSGVMAQAAAVGALLGLPPAPRTVLQTEGLIPPSIQTFADIETASRVAAVIARSPGAPLAVLQSLDWDAPPPAARALIERGRTIARLHGRLSQRFTAETFAHEHAADIAYVEQKLGGTFGFLAFLDGRYRAILRRWQAYRLPAYQAAPLDQAQEFKLVDQLGRERRQLSAAEGQGRQLFGALWQGEQSAWDSLGAYLQWVVEFRALTRQQGLGRAAYELAAQRAPNVTAALALQEAADGAQGVFAALRQALGWPADYLETSPLAATAERVRAVAGSLALAPRWAAFEAQRARAAQGLAVELVAAAVAGEAAFADLRAAFLRAFYQKWLAQVVQARAPLAAFATLAHEQRVAEFRQLDQRVLQENRAALVAKLRDQVQQRLQAEPAAGAMPYLRREMSRQRGLSPLRATLQHAEAAIRAIKPCFMMSPLSVAQLLPGRVPTFDLVIFDEASQLPPEDAVGAVVRGRQLIVVGDPKQLPPTNFFAVMGGQVTAPTGEDGLPLFEDGESVLEEYMGAGLPTSRLKWHYRSTHESLIAFSNVSFYDSDLHTFPSVDLGEDKQGMRFEYVAEGVYEGKGLNMAEARRVADAVVAHARKHPSLSLGVGTFNLRQQLAIQDELELRRRQDPSLEPFFARKEEGAFFVKNLENIQGDERDVIFISVTYARGPDGRLRYNFGPLNLQNGWRRLNVLATRARQRMHVFSSMRGSDIALAETVPSGARLLREFLLYAEHGRFDDTGPVSAGAMAESPFERDVFNELTRRGLRLAPQVGVSGYRIDFGVLHPDVPGRYVCGLECDGVAYHASETARDRDRLRQQVLEARGWSIYRVWSTDWFKDRAGQIERLLGLVTTALAEAKAEQAAEKAEAESEALAQAEANAQAAAPEASEPAPPADPDDYQRPEASAYRYTGGEGRYTSEILKAPASQLERALMAVLDVEAPLHHADLSRRTAGLWGAGLGVRIQTRIDQAIQLAQRSGLLQVRGEFVHRPKQPVVVRSRKGTQIPAERVAPEEYREALLTLLRTGHGFTRAQLINEVRALLGFGRATPALEAAAAAQIDALLNEGVAGEGSAGIALRKGDDRSGQ